MKPTNPDLKQLLATLNPELHSGEYVFCCLDRGYKFENIDVIASFEEQEGITIIATKTKAEKMDWKHSTSFAWITLQVFSSLESTGLTAAISAALAENNISCNVIAAYHHDHLFVPFDDAKRVIEILKNLSAKYQNQNFKVK